MLKKIALLLCLSTLISAAFSVRADTNLIATIQSTLHTYQTIHGEFEQTKKLAGMQKALKARGYFIVDQQRGVLWQTIKPFQTTTLIKQGEIIQKSNGQTLVSLQASKEPAIQSITTILFATLAGDFSTLEKIFTIEGVVQSNKNWQVNLVPRDTAVKNIIQTIRLTGNAVIHSAQLQLNNGDTTNIVFKNVEDISSVREKYIGEFN